jgi:hypothetical protein
MIAALCHQIPSMAAVMHSLGIFYIWHAFQQIALARVVCR